MQIEVKENEIVMTNCNVSETGEMDSTLEQVLEICNILASFGVGAYTIIIKKEGG